MAYTSDLLTNSSNITADSYYQSPYYPSKAIDDNTSTFFTTNVNVPHPHWLKYDFGSSTPKRIAKYTIRARLGQYYYTCPYNFKLQASNNGSTWTDIDTRSNQSFTIGEMKGYTFIPPTTSYRYYRLYATRNQVIAPYAFYELTQLAELEMMEDTAHPGQPSGWNHKIHGQSGISKVSGVDVENIKKVSGVE